MWVPGLTDHSLLKITDLCFVVMVTCQNRTVMHVFLMHLVLNILLCDVTVMSENCTQIADD